MLSDRNAKKSSYVPPAQIPTAAGQTKALLEHRRTRGAGWVRHCMLSIEQDS